MKKKHLEKIQEGKITSLFPAYEFRPVNTLFECLRYNEGKWTPDDGEYDLAFVGKTIDHFPYYLYFNHNDRPNILWSWCLGGNWGAKVQKHPNENAWHYMLREGKKDWGDSWGKFNHPNSIAGDSASRKCCDLYRCGNGRGPEFDVNDPYIKAGLVRNRKTKLILEPPKIFNCMYCGPLDWRKLEENYRKESL